MAALVTFGSTESAATTVVDDPIGETSYRWRMAGQADKAADLMGWGSPEGGGWVALMPPQASRLSADTAVSDPFLLPLIDERVVRELSFRTAEDLRLLGAGALDAFDRSVSSIMSSLRQPIGWVPVVADYTEAVALLHARTATWNTARLACIRRRSGGHGDVRLAPLAVYGWRC